MPRRRRLMQGAAPRRPTPPTLKGKKRRQPPPATTDPKATVGNYLDYLTCKRWRTLDILRWPPDVFGITAALLHRTGAYTQLVANWPPDGVERQPDRILRWTQQLYRTVGRWRAATMQRESAPNQIQRWWRQLLDRSDLPLANVRYDKQLQDILLLLTASADEACSGVGIPPTRDSFERFAVDLLNAANVGGSTLATAIPREHLRILPKMHTPQTGMSLRSLTHNLALCHAGDLETRWYTLPMRPGTRALNLLIMPWPPKVSPAQFAPARPRTGKLANMPANYGFFEYTPTGSLPELMTALRGLLSVAKREVGPIHGVILPELALTPAAYHKVRQAVLGQEAFLIAGVGIPSQPDGIPGQNFVALDLPLSPAFQVSVVQQKHHRWQLNRNQIKQYGLGYALDPGTLWWEHVTAGNRQLSFIAMLPWLTMCVLLCEDLARQEPVADVVRAVGPNLVIALLLDGPQLSARWPARYATVLAEDPGSSVLTVTSLGMASLSRPTSGPPGSRKIALWKDAKSGSVEEIECPAGADGVILCLTAEFCEEWTADGRSDGGATGYAILNGQHPVTAPGLHEPVRDAPKLSPPQPSRTKRLN